jgi:hypothetical protein
LDRLAGDLGPQLPQKYNQHMRLSAFFCAVIVLCGFVMAQNRNAAGPNSVTVPMTVDHNRIVVDADIPLPGGKTERVHAWVDNGNPDFEMSQELAALLGATVVCNGQICSATPPSEIAVGGMAIPLGGGLTGAALKEARVPVAHTPIAPGLHVEMNIPAALLCHYDVLIDFPGHELTIAQPGTIQFRGPSSKVLVKAENGLIQVPSQIENKKYNLGLDLGSSISFLTQELFEKLAVAHSDWPRMTGAIGPANMWGLDGEPSWKSMRLDRLQFGPLFLTNVAVVDFPKDRQDFFVQRAGISTAGLLGSQALQNYRVGLDYAHSLVHFEIGRTFNFPDFDAVGLILRPEPDGHFTILGVADFDGSPSVPNTTEGVQLGDHLAAVDNVSTTGSTMGQVWAMLGGTPGQERKLTIERAGKQFFIVAQVKHFLGEMPDEKEVKGKKK